MKVPSLCFGFLFLGLSSMANATLVSFLEDHGHYTTDLDTGIDWLDVTESVNKSYNYVSSQFGVGGEYEGWRYATAAELENMLTRIFNHTLDPNGGLHYVAYADESLDPYVSLFGNTQDSYCIATWSTSCDARFGKAEGDYLAYTFGMTGDVIEGVSPRVNYAQVRDEREDDNWRIDFYRTVADGFHWLSWDYAAWNMGSWLVRATPARNNDDNGDSNNTIPEPSILALMGLGLGGLIFARRRKDEA